MRSSPPFASLRAAPALLLGWKRGWKKKKKSVWGGRRGGGNGGGKGERG